MASLLIHAKNLSEGDIILLPFNKTATIQRIKPIGPRTQYVQFKTEYGWTRVGVEHEVYVEARVH